MCYTVKALSVGVSPSGKAKDFDSFTRWFKSSYPCQKNDKFRQKFVVFLACPIGFEPTTFRVGV